MAHKHHSNCLKFSISLIFMLFFQVSWGQIEELDDLIKKSRLEFGQEIVVMASRGDSIFYLNETQEYKSGNQEMIGEASGWFTAALAMKLVEEGKLKLDDPVAKYIPIFKTYAKNYLTVRHCLMNTTGILSDRNTAVRHTGKKENYAMLEEIVNDYAKKEIQYNPGEAYHFNKMGMAIAARVMEIVGKKAFERQVTEKIFRPLAMRKSTFNTEFGSDPLSGARTTAGDYILFLNMLLRGGKSHTGNVILSEESVQELLKIRNSDARVLFSPDYATQMQPAFGAWAIEAEGEKTVIAASPSTNGSWPFINICRGYSAIIFMPQHSKLSTVRFFEQVMAILDDYNPDKCN